jgi:signal transduction histidine kinase
MRQTLKLRSSRVTALARLALAAILILTSWLDPDYPFEWSSPTRLLFWGYLLFSVAMAAICWSDWWLAHRMRRLAFAIDFLTAFLVLYLIESAAKGLTSPFMGFFMFLVLTSTLIWRARTVAILVTVMLAIYVAMGLLLVDGHSLADPHWFYRRMAFMGLLSALVIWFGHTRTAARPDRLDWPFDASMTEQFAVIVDFVQRHMRASGVAIFWAPTDEPWIYLGVDGIAGHHGARLAPDALDIEPASDSQAILFDRIRKRSLHLLPRGEIAARRGQTRLEAAEFVGVEMGIYLPIKSETGTGAIVLNGLSGISGDLLEPVRALGAEIGMAIDRHGMAEMGRSKDLAQLRLTMARELHDGVAQSLAGTSFRLEALAQAYRAGKDISADLDSLQLALTREQDNVRDIINRLRMGDAPGLESNLYDALQMVCADARRRWGVACNLDCQTPKAGIPTLLLRHVDRIINEAVANAVKHGRAGKVDVTVRRENHSLFLAIVNPHSADSARPFEPKSIAERVTDMGGSLEILDDGTHTRLQIILPMSAER